MQSWLTVNCFDILACFCSILFSVVQFSISAWDDLKISLDIVIGTKPLHKASLHRTNTVTKEQSPSLPSKGSPHKLRKYCLTVALFMQTVQ